MMFKVVFTHDLVNPSKPVILKADTEAKLKLFEVFNEEDPYTDNFDLSIVCYDYKDKPFYFTSSSSDICKSTFNGSIYRLNEQISDLSIYIDKSALSEIEKGRLSVKYVLTDQTGNIKEFRFNIFTKIPITYVNEFSFQPRRNINNISENIATIDENYLKAYSNGKDYNYTSFDVKLDISSNLQKHIDSDTVHWRFINNSLKLQFSIPITVTKQFSIKVAIKDSKTDLSSDTFTVFFSSSDIESSSSAKITILVLFFVFCIFISSIVFLIFHIKKQKDLALKIKKEMKEEVETTNSQSTNVLSNSILNWNKKLVRKYQDKSPELSFDELDGKRQPRNYAYEKFDETISDSNNDIQFVIRDNFSEIRQDDDSDGMNQENRSSFLDDLRFQ